MPTVIVPGDSGVSYEAESSVRRANPNLDRLFEHLIESVGRLARRQAAEAIRKADC